MSVIQLSDESFQAQGTFLETVSRVFVLYIEEIQVCSNIGSLFFSLLFLAVWLFVRRGCEHHLSLFFIL